MSDLISFDYAIKYLLKDKGDYEIVEGFISALLVSKGYKPVKITALLESESNKESKYLKRSVADVIVADEQGNNYIVEIDKSYTDLFLAKAIFNTSRLIVDSLGTSQDYSNIKKVFHINLLYFPFENTKAPLHHGQVIFHEIDNSHPVNVHLINRQMHIFDSHNVSPEYFLISIPLFNDVIKKEIDEWLYVMKHSEVKESFKSPYMKKVAERLDILKMTNKEREIYDTYRMDSLKGRDYLVSAEGRGRAEGIAEGKAEGLVEGKAEGEAIGMEKERIMTIQRLKAKGMDNQTISDMLDLSINEIELLLLK